MEKNSYLIKFKLLYATWLENVSSYWSFAPIESVSRKVYDFNSPIYIRASFTNKKDSYYKKHFFVILCYTVSTNMRNVICFYFKGFV